MWLRTSSFVFFALCLECPLLLNVGALSDAETVSSLLSRASAWDCSADTDCTTNNSTCVDGYCECEDSYIYNTDMTACLLAATAYGDECTETLQCSTYLLSGSVCSDGVCTCNDGYHYTRGRCYISSALGEACTADVNCYVNADTEATSCVGGVCVCTDGFYQREYRTCRRGSYFEGDECAIDLDCQFENGVCDSSYVCALSTTETTESTTSTDNDDSVTEENDYEDSRVVRSVGRADENATVGTECASNDDCTTLANSRCGAAGTCICSRAYFASTDLSSCVAEMGEDCSSDDEVSITNSLCRDGAWSCGYSTVASISQQICRKSTKNYNWSCLHDEQCYIFGPDSSCQSKRCLCDEGSHHVEDLKFCWVSKGIGESCQADEDCYVEGLADELTCTDSVCTCPTGTIPNSNNTGCKSDDGVLGDVCEDDDDCSPANSACIDLVCGCPDTYYVFEDYCGRGINATCSADSDCVVTSATCTEDNLCDCSEDYVASAIDTCLALANYGEECQSDLQCSAALSNTYCSVATNTSDDGSNATETSSCECESDYHYRFDVCNLKSVIGDSCTSLGDCYVESGIDDVVCRKGTCACSFDASAVDTTTCSRTASDATTFSLSTWLLVFFLGAKIHLV